MSTVGKSIRCKAAVVWKFWSEFSIEEVDVDVPQSGEVRVQMASAGVCHSDLHNLEEVDPFYPLPSVFGHEGAGIVESVGTHVQDIQPGDVVVLCFVKHCGDCDYCSSPKTHFCRRDTGNFQLDGTSRITCRGEPLSQMNTVSTFSEYTVTSQHNVAKVNPCADPYSLCLAGCCIPTGYGAAVNTARVEAGSSCAVWGLGGVGMCAVMGCRDSGADIIIGIDTNSAKFNLAKELGCTHVLNPKEVEDLPGAVRELTGGDGADYCLVAVGSTRALEEAVQCSHKAWGRTVMIGITDIEAKVEVNILSLLKGRQLLGSHYGGYKPKKSIPGLVEKVLRGEIQLQELITHRFCLQDINRAFLLLRTGTASVSR